MKQIDIIKTYGQKRCLVVDDVPDLRTALKRYLIDFGASQVDTSGSAEEAIELCQRNQYDMVISDYNLGTGKSGQQLLEEIRFHGYLKNTSLFIIITAEAHSEFVLHALEFQPDEYINKPITRESLRPRLDQALLKNEALYPIKDALDTRNEQSALNACEKLLKSPGKYESDIKRIYGDLLTKYEQLPKAKALYEELLTQKDALWIKLGYARILILLQELEQAEDILLDVRDQHNYCVEALDLLGKVSEMRGNYERAQHEVASAAKLSPRSVQRQRNLGEIAVKNADLNAEVNAFRNALKLSKNSCHEKAEDYLRLSESLIDLGRSAPERLADATLEALDTLKQLEKRYSSHPIYQIRGKQLAADAFDLRAEEKHAQHAVEIAKKTLENIRLSVLSNTPIDLSLQCARSFMERGEFDESEVLLQEIAQINDDPEYSIQIDKLLRDPVTQEGIQYAAKENRLGISLYQQKNYVGAISAFLRVLDDIPNHIGLNLNLVQALISQAKAVEQLHQSSQHTVDMCFKRVGNIDEESKHYERFMYLQRQYEKLRAHTESNSSA